MAIRIVRSRIIALILLLIGAVVISYSTYIMKIDDIPGLARHEPHREAYATRPAIRHPEWLKEREPDTDLQRRRGIDDQVLDTRTLLRIKDLSRFPYMIDLDYQLSACPSSISSLTQQSRWLLERYKPDIKLFLNSDDLDTFDDIARHSLPFGYGQESKSMLARIITHPRFRKVHINEVVKKNKCLRCAVVGNGGILKDSGAGRAIDNHDFVFRLGHASTSEEFEMDVGSKTSFYVFSPETMHIDPKHPLDEDVGFIYAISNTYDIGYAISMLSGANPPPKPGMMGKVINLSKPQSLDPNRLRIIHPDVFRYVAAEYFDWALDMPSVDAMTVFMALQICDDVTAYGLVKDPRYPMYYFNENMVLVKHLVQRSRHGLAHRQESNAENERRLWQRLQREGALHLFKRDA